MNNLSTYRKAAGLTQEQLAEMTGIHRVTIAKYEMADNPGMTVSSACRLANALGCSLSELLAPNDQEGEKMMGGSNFKPDVTRNGMETYVSKRNGIQERYVHRVMNYQLEKIKALCDATGRRPSEIVNELLDYALARAQVREITRIGIVFEENPNDQEGERT